MLSTFSAYPKGMSSTFPPNKASVFRIGGNRATLAPRMSIAPHEKPLEPGQQAALEDVLRGLHRDLRDMLAVLPVEAQTASGLARRLKIERTTCQRAVSAATQPFAGLALVGQLPGVAGLTSLVESARQC